MHYGGLRIEAVFAQGFEAPSNVFVLFAAYAYLGSGLADN